MNNKAKVALKKIVGLRTDEVYQTVRYHELANQPEHDLTRLIPGIIELKKADFCTSEF